MNIKMAGTQKVYKCYLYTLNGRIEAVATSGFFDFANREVAEIAATDNTLKINVSQGTFDRKFWNEEKPTFYAC